jgi:phage tail sheath gpL-like
MASQTTIIVTHDKESTVDLKNQYQVGMAGQPRFFARGVQRLFATLEIGQRMGSVVQTIDDGDAVAASGTITLSSFVAADTFTIGTQVFTSSASPAGANQFLSTGGDTAVAAAAVLKINAHASLAGVVTATSALGVITVTSAVKGLIGNQIGIAISAHGSVSGSGKLTGGAASANSVSQTYAFGV